MPAFNTDPTHDHLATLIDMDLDDTNLDDTHRLRAGRQSRVLGAVIVAATVLGSGFVLAGLRSADGDDNVVLDVDAVTASVPSTVAPLAEPASDDRPDIADQTAPAGDVALSPLADLLGEQYSAVPDDVEPRPRPVAMNIDAFDVSRFPIRAVGLEPDGQFEVPDETEIGWYQYGATAGRPGSTVLAAHVSWNRTAGPFAQLGSLAPGNRISVALDNGTTREYEVFERAVYGKLELPRERIWSNTGPETLVLITCGGDFNPELRRYRENIVIYAAPIS